MRDGTRTGRNRAGATRPAPRTACLLVPDLPLAAELRACPELAGRPVAVASGREPRAEILAVTPEAAAQGVRPGQTLVHGRAACAGLVTRVASLELEHAARAALLDAALGVSPRAEHAPLAPGPWAGEAALFVDARGSGTLFRTESGFASALLERARRVGLPGVVAIAGSGEVARIAARRLAGAGPNADDDRAETVRVVPPGRDAAFLAPLSLDLLAPTDDLAQSFTRFGLVHIADLMRIPERALVSRFGSAVRPLLDLARGHGTRPPPTAPEPGGFEEAGEPEVAVQQLEPLLFVLRGLLSRLGARLECRGLAFADLELRLELEGGGRDARRVGVAAPTRDLAVLLRLLALSLESQPPVAAIERARIATRGAELRGDQLDFFRPAGPTPSTLAPTIAELGALCGADRVGAPAVADSHRPDAFRIVPFRPPRTGGASFAPFDPPRAGGASFAPFDPPRAGGASFAPFDPPRTGGASFACDREAPPDGGMLAIRALRPPVPAQVRAPRGAPEFVRSGLANGEVLRCAGPWRTTGHWWSEDERYAFDHYDVQTSDGLVVRLRFDWIRRGWQIDGLYD